MPSVKERGLAASPLSFVGPALTFARKRRQGAGLSPLAHPQRPGQKCVDIRLLFQGLVEWFAAAVT